MSASGGVAVPLVAVRDLSVVFPIDGGVVRAVDGISYDIQARRTLGVVGESGSGKSVAALALLRLVAPPGRIAAGSIRLGDLDLLLLDDEDMRRVRGARIAMIFQEPMTALNPVFTVGEQIAEVLRLHRGLGAARGARRGGCHARSASAFRRRPRVPATYPHQLSGGMRQRAMIAMALAGRPELLIADEPTTALDVTIQAQILDLMLELQAAFGMAVLFISHNLAVVSEVADDIMVMYAGRIVERAPADALIARPLHPYTQGLIAAVPRLAARDGGAQQALHAIPGNVPNPLALPPGCRFSDRCALADDGCRAADAGADRRRRRPRGRLLQGEAMTAPLLALRDVVKHFPAGATGWFERPGTVHAVNGVSLEVARGETVAVVGEFGLRQDDLGAARGRALSADRRRHQHRRHAGRGPLGEGAQALSPARADDLPGPVRLAQPAPAGLGDPRPSRWSSMDSATAPSGAGASTRRRGPCRCRRGSSTAIPTSSRAASASASPSPARSSCAPTCWSPTSRCRRSTSRSRSRSSICSASSSATSASRSCSSATIWPWSISSPTASPSCISATSSRSRRAPICSAPRPIPIAARSSPPCRSWAAASACRRLVKAAALEGDVPDPLRPAPRLPVPSALPARRRSVPRVAPALEPVAAAGAGHRAACHFRDEVAGLGAPSGLSAP